MMMSMRRVKTLVRDERERERETLLEFLSFWFMVLMAYKCHVTQRSTTCLRVVLLTQL